MRRPTSALVMAFLGTALAAPTVSAQRFSMPTTAGTGSDEGSAAAAQPYNPGRTARHLVRNGWDYITYQEYDRALSFFREAESRQNELNDAERLKLKQGVERAQRGIREKALGTSNERSYAMSGNRRKPGALAVAAPPTSNAALVPTNLAEAAPRTAEPVYERETIQLTAADATTASQSNVRKTSEAPRPVVAPELSEPPAIDAASITLPADPSATGNDLLPPLVDSQAQRVQAAAEPMPAPVALPEVAPESTPAPAGEPAPLSAPAPLPAEPPVPSDIALPTLPTDLSNLAPAAEPAPEPLPVQQPAPASEAAPLPASVAEVVPAPEAAPLPAPAAEVVPAPEAAPLPAPAAEVVPAPEAAPVPAPAAEVTPAPEAAPLPAPAVEVVPAPTPEPAPAAEVVPTPTPEPAPAPESLPVLPPGLDAPAAAAIPDAGLPLPAAIDPPPAPTLPPADVNRTEPPVVSLPGASNDEPLPPPAESLPPLPGAAARAGSQRTSAAGELPPTSLSPDLQREVEEVARRQDESMRRDGPGANILPSELPEPESSPSGSAASTRLEISRAPSPTEVRPIRAIPVPEEFVPLPKREWDPNRKYWAAAATCHLPLYFQDACLERYGYSMEQRFGRMGRFMSVPLDDPRQSKQRNQIAQPFFSIGLFAAQIALLPYNLIMDPPWEAEYDLGYYRPGDRVPTDVYYLPLFGVGPPLHGKNYGTTTGQGVQPPPSRW